MMDTGLTRTRRLERILSVLMVVALAGCSFFDEPSGVDKEGQVPVPDLPSPTPTWALPDPDDDDPVADCQIDAPICWIDLELIELGDKTFLAADLLLRPPSDDPDSWNEAGVDLDMTLSQDGGEIDRVSVDDHVVAVTGEDGAVNVSNGDGTASVGIASGEQGRIFTNPQGSGGGSVSANTEEGALVVSVSPSGPDAVLRTQGVGIPLTGDGLYPLLEVRFPIPEDRELSLEEDDEQPSIVIYDASGSALANIDLQNLTVELTGLGGSPFAAIDPTDQEIVLSDEQGIALAVLDLTDLSLRLLADDGATSGLINPKTSSVVLRDKAGDPVAAIDLKDNGLVISDAEGHLIGEAVPTGITRLFGGTGNDLLGEGGVSFVYFDPQGEPSAGMGLVNGLVVIATPGIGSLVLINPKTSPAGIVDPQIESVQMTILFPTRTSPGDAVDLQGTVAIFGKNNRGEDLVFGSASIELYEVSVVKIEVKANPTPVDSGEKASPTPTSLRVTATDAAKLPSATPAPPKPTATAPKPTDPPKPTATPEK